MCIRIRKSRDGTLHVAVINRLGIPPLDPVAKRIVFDAVAAHNDSIRAGHGPVIDTHPACDEATGRLARPPRIPATLPPYICLPARRRRSWRLPIALVAFVATMCLATFILPTIFGNTTDDVSRPVVVNVLPPPGKQLAADTGMEIE